MATKTGRPVKNYGNKEKSLASGLQFRDEMGAVMDFNGADAHTMNWVPCVVFPTNWGCLTPRSLTPSHQHLI